MSSNIESLDALPSKTVNVPEPMGLDLEEKEADKTVILYLTDKTGKTVGPEHTLTHTQLRICKMFFNRKNKKRIAKDEKMIEEKKEEPKNKKRGDKEEKKIEEKKVEEKDDEKNDKEEEEPRPDDDLELNFELEGKIPINMSTWARSYSVEEANYGLEKCVEWLKHYNGVPIPCYTEPLPRKPKLEELWKDHTFAEDGKTPWCVKWIKDIYAASVGCDKIYHVLLCADYFNIYGLIRLACCMIASVIQGKKFKDMPALIGGRNPKPFDESMKDDNFGSMKCWDWTYLSKNLKNFKGVHEHPDRPWNWYSLSQNLSITMDDVLAHQDKPWDWNKLSKNGAIPLKDKLLHSDKPWDWDALSGEDISAADLKAYLDRPWNWSRICRNPRLEIVNAFPDKQWDWEVLSNRVFISDVDKYPDLPWNWHTLSRNSHISGMDAKERKDKPWDWEWLKVNKPTDTNEMFARMNTEGFVQAKK